MKRHQEQLDIRKTTESQISYQLSLYMQTYHKMPKYICLGTDLAEEAKILSTDLFFNIPVLLLPDLQADIILIDNKFQLLQFQCRQE